MRTGNVVTLLKSNGFPSALPSDSLLESELHHSTTAEVLCGLSSGQWPQARELVSSELKWASPEAPHSSASSSQESVPPLLPAVCDPQKLWEGRIHMSWELA